MIMDPANKIFHFTQQQFVEDLSPQEALFQLDAKIVEGKYTTADFDEYSKCYLRCYRNGLFSPLASLDEEDRNFFSIQRETFLKYLNAKDSSSIENVTPPDDIIAIVAFQEFLSKHPSFLEKYIPAIEKYLFYASYYKCIDKHQSPVLTNRGLHHLLYILSNDIASLRVNELLFFPGGWNSRKHLGHQQVYVIEKTAEDAFIIYVTNSRLSGFHEPIEEIGKEPKQAISVKFDKVDSAEVLKYLGSMFKLNLSSDFDALCSQSPLLPCEIAENKIYQFKNPVPYGPKAPVYFFNICTILSLFNLIAFLTFKEENQNEASLSRAEEIFSQYKNFIENETEIPRFSK
jgi:hypothetical protein